MECFKWEYNWLNKWFKRFCSRSFSGFRVNKNGSVHSDAQMHMNIENDWIYDLGGLPVPTTKVFSKTPLPVKNMGEVNLVMCGLE